MATIIRSWNGVEKAFYSKLRIAIDRVAEKTKDVLYDFINEEIYIKNSLRKPGNHTITYERTYQFLQAITKGKVVPIKNGFSVSIYIDSNKIIPELRNIGFNAHMDIHGVPVGEGFWNMINDGNNSRLYSYEGIHFKEMIEEWLNENYVPLLKKELGL